MTGELDSKQIVDFAFQPVCRRPNARDTLDDLIRFYFQTHAFIGRNRKQVVDDFERRLELIGIMNARQVRKVIKRSLWVVSQEETNFDDLFASDAHRQLADKLRRLTDRS